MRLFWTFVTDLGDSAVTLPLAALVLIFLLFARDWQTTRAWIAMIAGCVVAIGALKLAFIGCGNRLEFGGIVTPSGHTAISVAVYLSFSRLLGGGAPRSLSLALYIGAALLVIGIGVSRLLLNVHDLGEVIIGFAVGIAGHIILWMGAARRNSPLPVTMMAISAIVLIGARHGTRWDLEPRLHHIAAWLRFTVPWCR